MFKEALRAAGRETATRPEIVTCAWAAATRLGTASTTIRELAAADDWRRSGGLPTSGCQIIDAEGLAEGPRRRRPAPRAAAACLPADVLPRRAANDAPTWQWRADAFPPPPPPRVEHAPRLDAPPRTVLKNASRRSSSGATRCGRERTRRGPRGLGRLRCVPGVAVGLEDVRGREAGAVELLEELAGDEAAAAGEGAGRPVNRSETARHGRAWPPGGPAGRVVKSGRARRRSPCAGDDGDFIRGAETTASPGETSPADPLYGQAAPPRRASGGLAAQAKGATPTRRRR